jgi:hypothetical protein
MLKNLCAKIYDITNNHKLGGSFMKNYDDWKKFVNTGKINDYLNYIACTQEGNVGDLSKFAQGEKEGGFSAGINYRNGNGSVGHAGW